MKTQKLCLRHKLDTSHQVFVTETGTVPAGDPNRNSILCLKLQQNPEHNIIGSTPGGNFGGKCLSCTFFSSLQKNSVSVMVEPTFEPWRLRLNRVYTMEKLMFTYSWIWLCGCLLTCFAWSNTKQVETLGEDK